MTLISHIDSKIALCSKRETIEHVSFAHVAIIQQITMLLKVASRKRTANEFSLTRIKAPAATGANESQISGRGALGLVLGVASVAVHTWERAESSLASGILCSSILRISSIISVSWLRYRTGSVL